MLPGMVQLSAFSLFSFDLGARTNYNQGFGLSGSIMAHISPDSMINDCSNMDEGAMTLIDVTLPVGLLTQNGYGTVHD